MRLGLGVWAAGQEKRRLASFDASSGENASTWTSSGAAATRGAGDLAWTELPLPPRRGARRLSSTSALRPMSRSTSPRWDRGTSPAADAGWIPLPLLARAAGGVRRGDRRGLSRRAPGPGPRRLADGAGRVRPDLGAAGTSCPARAVRRRDTGRANSTGPVTRYGFGDAANAIQDVPRSPTEAAGWSRRDDRRAPPGRLGRTSASASTPGGRRV
jgi:hypothetical protein